MPRLSTGSILLFACLAGFDSAVASHALGRAPTKAPVAASRTRVVMLGTGTPTADPDRFGPAVVVLVDSTPYLFDIGVGVVRRWAAALRAGAAPLGPATLRTAFVTHLHSDHTLGYAELIFTSWTVASGPPGGRGADSEIRSRRQPLSDVESQHRSATTCHLGNIAMRLGRGLRWDSKAESFLDDLAANSHLRRTQRAGFEIA